MCPSAEANGQGAPLTRSEQAQRLLDRGWRKVRVSRHIEPNTHLSTVTRWEHPTLTYGVGVVQSVAWGRYCQAEEKARA